MIGGLDAPAAIDNRAAAPANQPSVAVPRVQPPAADTTVWTVAVTDDQHEEMPISRIVELFAAATINDETYIWKQGMEDWQMPFDIPEIAAALRKRGFDLKPLPAAQKVSDSARATEKMQTAPPPAGMTAAGVWREPGSWNDGVAWKEPALAPGQEHHDVSFDDVTVALAAPQAEALLRDAELAAALDKDEKEEPTAIFPGGPEAPPLSSPRPVLSVPRPAAGRPVPRPDPKPTSDAAALAGHPTPPAIAIETKPPAAPLAAADSVPASATPASRRATPVERPDLFGEAHRAGSEESQQDEDSAAAGAQKLIGERNESSVLFSLDKVVETEQQHAQHEKEREEKQREEELLGLPTAPPPPEAQALRASLMSAAEEAAIDSALAAPDLSAPVVEKTAPMPPVEPAPAPPPVAMIPAASPAVTANLSFEEPKLESGSGWLWAVLLLLLAGAAAAIVIFYLRPAALFGSPPAATETAGSALPVPAPAPLTSLEPAITPPASSAPPVASSAAPKSEVEPPARPKDRVEPRRPRDEESRPIRRERDRRPREEPSEDPAPSEEQKPPVNVPPMEREEGPRP
jgi:hypothetical protein